jgi:hypothetical protein
MKFFTQIPTNDIILIAQEEDPYMNAVKSDDKETAQRMVDEAAKAAGYTVGPRYHGSRSKKSFTKFDPKKRSDNSLGKGYYFTDVETHAEAYSKGIVVASYLRLKNPFVMDWRTDSGRRESEEAGKKAGISIMGGYWFNGNQQENTNKLKSAGYDGVIAKQPESDSFLAHEETVVFDPDQIKSADPVTYDNQKKPIPLSRRFDSSKKDIRY